MNRPTRATREVSLAPSIPLGPEPFQADYGPVREEVLTYIDRETDQSELAGGRPGQHFDW